MFTVDVGGGDWKEYDIITCQHRHEFFLLMYRDFKGLVKGLCIPEGREGVSFPTLDGNDYSQ